jgi:hypothetical protein
VILPILLAIAAQPSIIPKPVSVVFSGKTPFRIDSTTQIRDDRNVFASGLLHDLLQKGAKLDLKRTNNLRLPGIEFQPQAAERKVTTW